MLVKLDHFPQSSGWKFKQKNNWNQHLVFSTESFLKIHELDHPSFYKGAAAVAQDMSLYRSTGFSKTKKERKTSTKPKTTDTLLKNAESAIPLFLGGIPIYRWFTKKDPGSPGLKPPFFNSLGTPSFTIIYRLGLATSSKFGSLPFFSKMVANSRRLPVQKHPAQKSSAFPFVLHPFFFWNMPPFFGAKQKTSAKSVLCSRCLLFFVFYEFSTHRFLRSTHRRPKKHRDAENLGVHFFFHEKCSQNATAVSFFCWQTANNLTCSLFRVSFE